MRYEYRVLSQKDRWFSDRIDPEKLATALNDLAAEGWRVIGIASAPVAGLLTSRDELIVVLEREYTPPAPKEPRAPKPEPVVVTRACPKCGKPIDAKATRCVHCLEPVPLG